MIKWLKTAQEDKVKYSKEFDKNKVKELEYVDFPASDYKNWEILNPGDIYTDPFYGEDLYYKVLKMEDISGHGRIPVEYKVVAINDMTADELGIRLDEMIIFQG